MEAEARRRKQLSMQAAIQEKTQELERCGATHITLYLYYILILILYYIMLYYRI